VLDYYLKEKAAAPIQLEILDSEGRLVRRFASDDEVRKVNPDDLPFPASWAQSPPPPSAEAGMHRFVWDLRYAAPVGPGRRFRGGSGPWALPGTYTIKLTAHGKSASQPLTIKMDPRVKTTQEQLVRQFELASRLSARQGEVSAATQQASELRKQIEARKKEAGANSDAAKALDDFNQKLDALTEQDGGGGFGLFGLSLPNKEQEPMGKVASALSGLMSVVESADVAPSADAAVASDKWDHAASETMARWSTFQKEELANANAVLQRASLKPLVVTEPPSH
jgi:hypothetical protein